MNYARELWDGLVESCEKCDLPNPILRPGLLGDRFEIKLGDRFRAYGDSIQDLLCECCNFVSGYEEGMEDAKKMISGQKSDHHVFAPWVYLEQKYGLKPDDSVGAIEYNVD